MKYHIIPDVLMIILRDERMSPVMRLPNEKSMLF